jgi:hypothetical protein
MPKPVSAVLAFWQFWQFWQFWHFGIFSCLPKLGFGSFGSFGMPKLYTVVSASNLNKNVLLTFFLFYFFVGTDFSATAPGDFKGKGVLLIF